MQEQTEGRTLTKVVAKKGSIDGKLIILTNPTVAKFDKNAKKLQAVEAKDGSIYYLKHLTTETIGTVVAKGIFESVQKGTFQGQPTLEYHLRAENGDLFKLKGCATLNGLFKEVAGLEGDVWIEITFNGINKNVKPGKKPFLDYSMEMEKV